MSVEDNVGMAPKVRRLWLRIADAIAFGGASLLTVIGVGSTVAQPLSTGRALAYILLAPMATIAFHRGLAFLERRRRRSAQQAGTPSRPIGLVKWLGAPIGAVLLCGGLEAFVQERGLAVVRDDLAPLVRAFEAKLSANEPAPSEISDAVSAARDVHSVEYFPRERAFVLAARGGSIDMDGETIYYDSQDREWRRFHNDLAETDVPEAVRFKAATRETERIQYRRSGGTWMRAQWQ